LPVPEALFRGSVVFAVIDLFGDLGPKQDHREAVALESHLLGKLGQRLSLIRF
jgi:hypothetical protein